MRCRVVNAALAVLFALRRDIDMPAPDSSAPETREHIRQWAVAWLEAFAERIPVLLRETRLAMQSVELTPGDPGGRRATGTMAHSRPRRTPHQASVQRLETAAAET